ncbi:MAG: hypothetical protein ACI85I_000478 [Arenicella sp.]|jgi:hypothetical protein
MRHKGVVILVVRHSDCQDCVKNFSIMPGWRSRITVKFLGDFGRQKNKPTGVLYLISWAHLILSQ